MKITTPKIILSFAFIIYACVLFSQNTNTDSLKKVLLIQKDDTSKVNNLIAVSKAKNNIAEYDEAKEYADQALELSEKIGFKKGIANSYMQIGRVYFFKSDFFNTLKYYQKALTICEQLGNKAGMAANLQGMGLTYQNLSDYPKALEYGQKALKILEEAGNIKGSAGPLHNIGMVYNALSEDTVALIYYLKAMKINLEYGNKHWLCRNYEAIGNIYLGRNNFTEALANYNASLKIAEETGDRLMANSEIANIGIVYKEAGKYDEALRNYFTSLKFFEESGDSAGIALANYDIAEVYQKRGNFKEAFLYQTRGLSFAKAAGAIDLIKLSFGRLAEIDSAMNNFNGAYENHKLYMQYNDSLFNLEKDKKLTQLQMQYDFDKKETATKAEHDKREALSKVEIKRQTLIRNSTFAGVGIAGIFSFFLVRSVNRRRKTSFEKQVSQVEMKALRSQMNPHFIFNSLNSIHSFIQQNKGEKASDYLIKFSRLMRLILENSNHEEVPLESDLEALGLYMELEAARMNNKFTFSIDVSDDIDQENTTVPPLILQPFVENSIWHGMMHKEENGLIKINISKNGDMVKCTVEDNGVGREKAKELKSTTQKGKHESLGMKITNERIAIINRIKKSKAFVALKDLHDDAKKPLGTLVEVQLPLETGF